jgi:hypothetical protein
MLTFTDIVASALNTTQRVFRTVKYLPVSPLLCRWLSQIDSLRKPVTSENDYLK